MIDKELSEILDALTRESGECMLPYQELELFGFSPIGTLNTRFSNDEPEDDEIDYDEEYEFDEDDEQYALLAQVLRLNNCRKKYFA